jgi:hypothetical protein
MRMKKYLKKWQKVSNRYDLMKIICHYYSASCRFGTSKRLRSAVLSEIARFLVLSRARNVFVSHKF